MACILIEAADYWRYNGRRGSADSRAGSPEPESEPEPGASRGVGRGFRSEAPLLLLGDSSLAELNARLVAAGAAVRVGASRFRPNLVVSGCTPHAEDAWAALELAAPPQSPWQGPLRATGEAWQREALAAIRLEARGLCGRCDLVNVAVPGESSHFRAEADAGASCSEGCGGEPRKGPWREASLGGGRPAAADADGASAEAAGKNRMDGLSWSSLHHKCGAEAGSSREPLATLAGYRRVSGRVRFGLYVAPVAAAASSAASGIYGWIGVGWGVREVRSAGDSGAAAPQAEAGSGGGGGGQRF